MITATPLTRHPTTWQQELAEAVTSADSALVQEWFLGRAVWDVAITDVATAAEGWRVTVRATPTGPAWTPLLGATTSCASRACVAQSVGETSGAPSSLELVNNGAAAATYYVSVANAAASDGTFDLTASAPTSFAAGATCTTALLLTPGTPRTMQNLAAAFLSGAPLCLSGFTQPQLYQRVSEHPTVRQQYAEALVKSGAVPATLPDELVATHGAAMEAAYAGLKPEEHYIPEVPVVPPSGAAARVATGVPLDRLVALNEALSQVPAGFTLFASTDTCPVQMIGRTDRPVYATQFHPEQWDDEHPDGRRFLENFFRVTLKGQA